MKAVVLKYPIWQELYRAAVTETNPKLVKQKIADGRLVGAEIKAIIETAVCKFRLEKRQRGMRRTMRVSQRRKTAVGEGITELHGLSKRLGYERPASLLICTRFGRCPSD